MKFRLYILAVIVSLVFHSCDDQWINSGPVTIKEFSVDEFSHLYIDNNFEIYLIQDTTCKIEVEAGEKLISNVVINHDSDSSVTLSDNNKNEWLQGYDKIKLYISVKELRYIKVNACCTIKSLDTLETIGLQALSLDDYSDFDIKIKTNNLYFVTSESSGGYYKFSGETINWGFWARGSAIIESRDLECVMATAKSESIGHCYIDVNDIIEANILNTGNIYYTGNPHTITYVNEKAKKQLIKLD